LFFCHHAPEGFANKFVRGIEPAGVGPLLNECVQLRSKDYAHRQPNLPQHGGAVNL
jgi:hypothetical protein